MVREITELPHPEILRTECLDGCMTPDYCNKVFELADGKKVCTAYENPEIVWKRGPCYLASNKVFKETAKEKMKRKFGKKRRFR